MDDDEDYFGLNLPAPDIPKASHPEPPASQKPTRSSRKTPKASQAERPTDVPILVRADLVWLGKFQNGCRDLRYWLIETFGEDTEIRHEAEAALGEIVTDWAGCLFPGAEGFCEQANRNMWPSLSRQAAFWNEMLHQIGYTVPQAVRYDPGPREVPE